MLHNGEVKCMRKLSDIEEKTITEDEVNIPKEIGLANSVEVVALASFILSETFPISCY